MLLVTMMYAFLLIRLLGLLIRLLLVTRVKVSDTRWRLLDVLGVSIVAL